MDQRVSHARPLAPEFKLDGVPSTLLIPLVARAFGDDIFPGFAVGDAHAAQALAPLDVDVAPFLSDKVSVLACSRAPGFSGNWRANFLTVTRRRWVSISVAGLPNIFNGWTVAATTGWTLMCRR
jgi:hypothetical protein